MESYDCLMIGAGHTALQRKVTAPGTPPPFRLRWTSLDMNPEANPDIVFNLDDLHFRSQKIPVEPETFWEIHAYEVLEHIGRQGNYQGFFNEFREYWRILKPGGYMIGTCPARGGPWEWDDPGHTRVITNGTLSYLTRDMYKDLGNNAASDYRSLVDPYWWKLRMSRNPEDAPWAYVFALQKDE